MPYPPESEGNVVPTQILQYLLERIEEQQVKGFDRLEKAVAEKADKSDVARLEARQDQLNAVVETHTQRLDNMEDAQHDEDIKVQTLQQQKTFQIKFKHKVWVVLTTVAIILATALSGWIGAHL